MISQPSIEAKTNSTTRGGLLLLLQGLLTLAVALLFLTSPRAGDFWWSDAPRHALDGAFYLDLIRQHPFTPADVRVFAAEYYLQYPALTILFYPPGFAVVEAIFFAIFGVSHEVAQLTVAAFYLAAALGVFHLVRRWRPDPVAFAVSLVFIALPEIALWGRQVMLEIPAMAFVLWSAHFFVKYGETQQSRYLTCAMFLFAGGIYTKQPVAFLLPLFVWVLWRYNGGLALFKRRALWINCAAVSVLMLPLAAVTLKYGAVNGSSVVGGKWATKSIYTLDGWLFYFEMMPRQLNWIVFLLAIGGLVALAIAWKRGQKGAFGEAEKFFLIWFATGYLFFTAIALKEPRLTTPILLPLAFFAVDLLRRLPAPAAMPATVVLGAGTLAFTLVAKPVPYVNGYRHAAEYVSSHAPGRSSVLFSGYRDGSFVFNMREFQNSKDLAVVRADKILLRVLQRKELGVWDLNRSEEEILRVMEQCGVSYIVNEPTFWLDQPSLRRFQDLLKRSQFEKVAEFKVDGDIGEYDRVLEVYRNKAPLQTKRSPVRIELPLAGITVEGEVNGGHRRLSH